VTGDPKTLDEKERKESRRDALRKIEVEAAETRESVSHPDGKASPSLNGCTEVESEQQESRSVRAAFPGLVLLV
jgi:hypothetical protein